MSTKKELREILESDRKGQTLSAQDCQMLLNATDGNEFKSIVLGSALLASAIEHFKRVMAEIMAALHIRKEDARNEKNAETKPAFAVQAMVLEDDDEATNPLTSLFNFVLDHLREAFKEIFDPEHLKVISNTIGEYFKHQKRTLFEDGGEERDNLLKDPSLAARFIGEVLTEAAQATSNKDAPGSKTPEELAQFAGLAAARSLTARFRVRAAHAEGIANSFHEHMRQILGFPSSIVNAIASILPFLNGTPGASDAVITNLPRLNRTGGNEHRIEDEDALRPGKPSAPRCVIGNSQK